MTQELLITTETELLLVGEQPPEQIIEQVPGPVTLLEVAQQGPPGPIGLPGNARSAVAAAPLSGHRAVAYQPDGRVVHASADNPDHMLALAGVITESASEGETVRVYDAGTVQLDGWAWTPGPVLLGLNGALVQAIPATAAFVRALGHGSGDRIALDIQTPYAI